MKPKLAGQEAPVREHDEQQPDQDEAPAVTVSAGLATATGAATPEEVPAETPESEDEG